MAIRKCPQCLTVIPAGEAAACSDTITCPGCRKPLEVASLSRHFAVWLGLGAAAGVWLLTRGRGGSLGWVLPIVYAFLAYSFTSALMVMLTADLRNRPIEPPAEPVHAAESQSLQSHP